MPLTKQALRELLTAEMLCFHPEFAAAHGVPTAGAHDEQMQDAAM